MSNTSTAASTRAMSTWEKNLLGARIDQAPQLLQGLVAAGLAEHMVFQVPRRHGDGL